MTKEVGLRFIDGYYFPSETSYYCKPNFELFLDNKPGDQSGNTVNNDGAPEPGCCKCVGHRQHGISRVAHADSECKTKDQAVP